MLGAPKSPSKHTDHLPQTPIAPSLRLQTPLRSVFPISAPISWFCLLTTKIGYPCREDRLEKSRQESHVHRRHCKTVFSFNLDLRPYLDSPVSKLGSEAVSGHDAVKSGEGKPYLGLLLTSRDSWLTGQASNTGTES